MNIEAAFRSEQPITTEVKKPRRLYWICQVLGWLAYSAVGITINLMGGGHLGPLLVGHLAFISSSIGLTHLFRWEIRKRWPEKPLLRLWPLLAGGILIISICQATIIILINLWFGGNWSVVAVVALWWGMVVATSIWTVLYIRLVERRSFTLRESSLQLALREAQLHALEFQMSPHFLFNCLNSIRALVAVDPARAQDMLTRLANVLRNRLGQGRRHTVALGSEVEVVTDYLALEGIRFDDRLNQEISIEPEAAACSIPPLLLQTLVENAIKHGISRFSGRGELAVRACVEGGCLKLEVENTGRLPEDQVSSGGRVGLANARERLHLLYGDQASLQLMEDKPNGRVKATVLIPAAS